MRSSVVLLVTLIAWASSTRAQTALPWVVIPASATFAEAELLQSAVDTLESALRESALLTNHNAAVQMERLMMVPANVDHERLRRLQEALDQGAAMLKAGYLSDGQHVLQPLEAASGAEKTELRRDPMRAQQMFDVCLMTAKLLQREKKSGLARQQMLECVQGFPAFHPSRASPELRSLFNDAVIRASKEPHGTLEVRGAPDCVVRLLGLEVGASPTVLDSIATGPAEVQLECERGVPGRRHQVNILPGVTRITIDPRFDMALHTDRTLGLAYENSLDLVAYTEADAVMISRELGAHAVLVTVEEASSGAHIRVRAPGDSKRELGSLHYSPTTGFAQDEVAAVVLRLSPVRSQTSKRTASTDVPVIAKPVASPILRAEEDDGQGNAVPVIAGTAASAIGVGTLIAGWTMYVVRQNYRLRFWPQINASVVDGFESRGAATVWLSVIGATHLVAAEYLLLPESDGVPLSAWIAGVAGVIVTGIGVVHAINGQHCAPQAFSAGGDVDRACQSGFSDGQFGPMLMLASVPLLNVPLTYLLRSVFRASPAPLSLNATGVSVHVVF